MADSTPSGSEHRHVPLVWPERILHVPRIMSARRPPRLVLATLLVIPLLLSGCLQPLPARNDDATVTARVKTALLNDPGIGALTIDVMTSAGVVTLSGTVKSPSEKQRAVAIARGVNGVKSVNDALRVAGG
jgi:hyperosmotically inducible protein